MDIQIIKVDSTTRQVTFELQPKIITGILKLVQIIVISLLKNPNGRSVFFPEKGAGMMSLVGQYNLNSDSTDVFAEVARMVKKTENEVISDQISSSDSDYEKLSEIQIVNIKQGSDLDSLYVQLRVVNQAGQTSDIMV